MIDLLEPVTIVGLAVTIPACVVILGVGVAHHVGRWMR